MEAKKIGFATSLSWQKKKQNKKAHIQVLKNSEGAVGGNVQFFLAFFGETGLESVVVMHTWMLMRLVWSNSTNQRSQAQMPVRKVCKYNMGTHPKEISSRLICGFLGSPEASMMVHTHIKHNPTLTVIVSQSIMCLFTIVFEH